MKPIAFPAGGVSEIHTNSRGLRTREFLDLPDPEVLRIVCLGDSNTFGWGVDEQHSFPRLLESLLFLRHPAGRFEVINAGIPGYTSLHGLRLWRRDLAGLRPDVVTICFGNNDFTLTTPAMRRMIVGPASRKAKLLDLAKHSALVRLVLYYWATVSEQPEAHNGPQVTALSPEQYEGNIRAIRDEVLACGAQPILVESYGGAGASHPILERISAETGAPLVSSYERMKRWVADRGAPERGADSEFDARARGPLAPCASVQPEFALLCDVGHLNELGNRLVAEGVAQALEDQPVMRAYLKGRCAGDPRIEPLCWDIDWSAYQGKAYPEPVLALGQIRFAIRQQSGCQWETRRAVRIEPGTRLVCSVAAGRADPTSDALLAISYQVDLRTTSGQTFELHRNSLSLGDSQRLTPWLDVSVDLDTVQGLMGVFVFSTQRPNESQDPTKVLFWHYPRLIEQFSK